MTAIAAHAVPRAMARSHSSRRRTYNFVFGVASVGFLATTIVSRLNPLRVRNARRQSILAEARARAAATVPFIFMG